MQIGYISRNFILFFRERNQSIDLDSFQNRWQVCCWSGSLLSCVSVCQLEHLGLMKRAISQFSYTRQQGQGALIENGQVPGNASPPWAACYQLLSSQIWPRNYMDFMQRHLLDNFTFLISMYFEVDFSFITFCFYNKDGSGCMLPVVFV